VLETEDVIDVVVVKEEHSEGVKDVLTVADGDALIDGLPLDDQEATSDDETLALADPEPDNEDELVTVF
jgi:hypothetical protein